MELGDDETGARARRVQQDKDESGRGVGGGVSEGRLVRCPPPPCTIGRVLYIEITFTSLQHSGSASENTSRPQQVPNSNIRSQNKSQKIVVLCPAENLVLFVFAHVPPIIYMYSIQVPGQIPVQERYYDRNFQTN